MIALSNNPPLLLPVALPQLALELDRLLKAASRPDLAAQVAALTIVDRCRCGDEFCATIYTQPKPAGAWGAGLECVDLDAEQGMIILDVVQGIIVEIEVLNRDELRKDLLRILP